MDAPKCRLCEKRHWGVCFVSSPVEYLAVELGELVVNEADREIMVVNAPEMVANSKHGIYADKDKRRAYQREYMRKRRDYAKGV